MNLGSGYVLRGVQGRVIDSIGRAIVGGRYVPGASLPREAELMEEYGVSRTSLREAMKVLAAKGLIEIRQKSGTRVRPRSSWNVFDSDLFAWSMEHGGSEAAISDLIELRLLLEPSAARLAASRATMADATRIDAALTAMTAATADREAYAEHDVAFHLAVFAASHNVFLERFGSLVADFLRLTFDMQQKVLLERTNEVDFTEDAARHRVVYDGITRGAPDAAADAMTEVVLDGKRNLIAAVEAID
ncbi:FadR/GntR family transcriptional regulator [Amnibacterium sp. CER49]|uniref:FadR/GntR family transcriptional regulator n=1 Tax=Amnibacterium sp. CER49 TaxID=3039161 RepID=UPI00244B4B05|nr:FadR/GntR family transcriptional regulator [Amnibacterium sp. CER49]MDH2444106.1 FadR/GntR family transcriptional regulator [Amnibacterium sp. CER49]